MSFESELHDLLEEVASRFEPDPAVVDDAEQRAAAMLRARRRRWGIAAAAVVALIAAVGTSLSRGPAPEPPVIVDQPSPETSPEPTGTESPSPTGDVGPELTLAGDGSIQGLVDAPDRGVLVQVDARVVLVGLDGSVVGHLEGQLAGARPGELADEVVMPGHRSLAHLPAVTVDGVGDVWLDPVDAAWQPASTEAPLLADGRVVYDVDQPPDQRVQLYGAGGGPEPVVLASWPEGESWWLSSDHRVVTWRACWDDHECPHAFYDSDMGGPGELDPGCWIANAFGDLFYTEICHGTLVATSLGPDRDEYPVPLGTDGQAAIAVAAFDGGVVRVDHASCDIVEPMRIVEGEGLVPLLGPTAASNPSAVPLGTTPDGRVVLHYNAAACDATDRHPGVYVFDPETGGRELVYDATLHPGEVQMWGPFSPVSPTGARDVSQTPGEAERDGVLPAVAALTFDQRVELPTPARPGEATRIETAEGVWIVSRMPRETAGDEGCGLGDTDDPNALFRRDVICTTEYGEVLLLDHDEQRILRAFPLPGLPPQRIAVSDDAVWCARVGDGGLPHSVLCRIDRDTHEWQVRIFPHHPSWEQHVRDGNAGSGIDPTTGELWLPDNWSVEDGDVRYDQRFLGAEWTFEDGVLAATGRGTHVATARGTLRYAPDTLEPIPPCALRVDTEAVRTDGAVELITTISVEDGAESCGFDPTVTWELLDSNGWPVQVADEAVRQVQHVIEPGSPIELTVALTNWCGDAAAAPSTMVFHAGPFGQHPDPIHVLPDCEDPGQLPALHGSDPG